MLKRYISKYISSADSNCNEFCAGCRTALSRFCVLLTGSYGDSIWLQAVLYASGGYVSRRDSFASYTCVYTGACLNLSITSFEKVEVTRVLKHYYTFAVKYQIIHPPISVISIPCKVFYCALIFSVTCYLFFIAQHKVFREDPYFIIYKIFFFNTNFR